MIIRSFIIALLRNAKTKDADPLISYTLKQKTLTT